MSTGGSPGLGAVSYMRWGSQEGFSTSYAYVCVHVIYTLWLTLCKYPGAQSPEKLACSVHKSLKKEERDTKFLDLGSPAKAV